MTSITTSLGRFISRSETPKSSPYIAGLWYDYVFFIYSPLLALMIGIGISGTPFATETTMILGREAPLASIFLGTFIMAHLFIVFFRSHLNRQIFAQYPLRFTVVPLALFAAMMLSPWLAVAVSVLATWWDVYHSSMQTFGLGRIYDMKAGNDARLGRTLDKWLNLLLYAGPILAGATLMEHMDDFDQFEEVGSAFFTAIPSHVDSYRGVIRNVVVGIGLTYLLFYLGMYWRFASQGYNVSFQKVALLVSTGFCSVLTWGFNSFGEAFFIMNFFHAWQYFAIVWWMERKNIVRTIGMSATPGGTILALLLLLGVGLTYGFWAEIMGANNTAAYSLVTVISIMHFWYDGFIWSVSKKQV